MTVRGSVIVGLMVVRLYFRLGLMMEFLEQVCIIQWFRGKGSRG